MNDLILNQEVGQDYREVINSILGRLIIFPDIDSNETQIILNVYNEELDKVKFIPSLYSILQHVEDLNDETFYEAAFVEFFNEYDQNDCPDDESRDEAMDEIVTMYRELYQYDMVNTPTSIVKILSEYRLSYTFEDSDEYYVDSGFEMLNLIAKERNSKLIANDSQNLLLPTMIYNKCAGYEEYINFYDIGPVKDQLMLGG